MSETVVTAADWTKGIGLSVLASIVGGASKLAIRKSWLLQIEAESVVDQHVGESDDRPIENDNRKLSPGVSNDILLPDHHDSMLSRRPAVLSSNPSTDSRSESNLLDGNEEQNKHQRWIAYTLRYSGMFGMTVLNPLCCVLAMNYASPSILAPFSGLTLVWIVILSHPLIGEKPSAGQTLAASLVIMGEVIVAVFGDHTNDAGVTLEDVRNSYMQPLFIVFFGCMLLWMLMIWYFIVHTRSSLLRKFCWGVAGGSITGLQNFLKDSLTILKATPSKSAYPWYLALFVILAACIAFGGLFLLTMCMKRYDATFSSAMFVGSFVIFASIMSSIHYDTFHHLDSTSSFIMYPVGLVVLMGGICLLVDESKEFDADSNDYINVADENIGGSQHSRPLVTTQDGESSESSS